MTNEILSDTQLDNVNGGFIDVDKTNGEYFSLGVRVKTYNPIVGCPGDNAKGYDIKF